MVGSRSLEANGNRRTRRRFESPPPLANSTGVKQVLHESEGFWINSTETRRLHLKKSI